MAITIRCTQCSTEFDVPDNFAGKQGRCPECNAVLRAPEAGASSPSRAGAATLPKAKPVAKALPPVVRDPSTTNTVRFEDTIQNSSANLKPAPLASRAPAPAPAPSVSGPVIATGVTAPAKSPMSSGENPMRGSTAGIPASIWIGIGVTALVLVVGGGVLAWNLIGNKKPDDVAQNTKPGKTPTTPPKRVAPVTGGKIGEVGSTKGNEHAKPLVGRTIEDVRLAMVKIAYPAAPGRQSLGSGFIIDGERGWVATNHHVIDGANSAIRCTMADGEEYAVAGLIADSPEQDLAIIKLADHPFKMTYLDLGFFGNPRLGSNVFSYGHPHGVQFTLNDGVVSNVASTQKLDPGSQQFLYSTMRCDPEYLWIQHSCNIHPGNSGGPLLDRETLKVIGVNTWVSTQAQASFASHVQYLRDLKESAKDVPKPFPAPKPGQEIGSSDGPRPTGEFSVRRLTAVAGSCAGFDWKPDTEDEYGIVAEFAFLLTLFKELKNDSSPFQGRVPENLRTEMAEAADRAFQEVEKLDWNNDRLQAFIRNGASRLAMSGTGLATVCTVEGTVKGGLLLELEDGNKLAAAETTAELAKLPKGTRLVIFGLTSPLSIDVKPDGASESVKAKVIKVNYAVQLKG